MITTGSELAGPSGVLKDSNLISCYKDLQNSFDDCALERDNLTPKLQGVEQMAEMGTLLMPF